MQKIEINSYNIYGQVIRKGNLFVDIESETIITNKGKKLKVVSNYEYCYKIEKNQIKAINGINGLVNFINQINTPDSPFNPSRTNVFIEL
jgi:hypothetical protein